MGIELAPYFQFLTVQIESRGGKNIWFDLDEGLSIIYGLNGTGKTTIVNGINRLFRSTEEQSREQISNQKYPPGKSRGYFGFSIPLALCEFAHDAFSEFEESNPDLRTYPREFHDFEKYGLNLDSAQLDKKKSITRFKSWYLDEWLDKNKSIPEMNSLSNELDDGERDAIIDYLVRAPGLVLNQAIEQQGHALSNPFDTHQKFISHLRRAIVARFTDWEFSKPNAEHANELGMKYGVEFNFDDDTFADRGFGDCTGDLLLELYLYSLVEKFHNVVSERIDDCEWFSEDEVFEHLLGNGLTVYDCIEDLDGIASVIFSTIKHSLASPVFWFEPSNRRGINHRFGLSMNLSVGKLTNPSVVELKELIEEIPKVVESKIQSPHKWALIYALKESELFDTASISGFDGFGSDWPFLNLDVVSEIGDFPESPLKVVNIGQSIDFDSVAQKTLMNLVRGEGTEASFSMNGLFGEGIIEIPNIEIVNDYMDRISAILQRLDIGLKRCKFQYSESLPDWVAGNAASFVFVTVSTSVGTEEYDIPFSRLSSAQQYWVQAAFWLMSVETSDGVCVVTADEPESGLHERAVIQVFNELSKTRSSCVITSHSSRALRLPNARLLHLERVKSGELVLGRPWLGEDIAAAAERLGTTTFDLFALKRALVIVEGSHDVEVIKGLASLHMDGILLDQILIVPARGVKNVATVADSVVITEFTSLHILAITDNGRAELLGAVIAKANEALSFGATAAQAIITSGLRDIDNNATFEERVMQDLIERAIHRGMLHRLHIYALPVEDIVDLLPEKAFGLETTWKELRDEHRRFPVRMSFKDWLRAEKNVSVSVKSIKRAFDSIDSLNEPLSRILHELDVVASLSPLEGSF
jgi:hypothetical protein